MDNSRPQSLASRDIEKIFSKLEEEKVLDQINDLYYKAFVDSSQTILEDFNDSSSPDLKAKMSYESIFSLFKNKFTMVSQVMIDTLFNHVLSKKTPKLDSRKSLTVDRSSVNGSGLGLIESARDKEDEVSTDNILQDQIETSKSKPLTKSQKALKAATSPLKKWKKKEASPEVKEVTYILRPNKGNTPRKKPENLSNINSQRATGTPSKANYSVSHALSSRSPSGIQSALSTACTIKNVSILQDRSEKSILTGYPYSPSRTLNQTALNQTGPSSPNASMRQPRSNNSISFVQSEFNHIRGQATFGRSPRSSWVDAVARTDSPGPGKYNPTPRNSSPSPSIGRAPRVSWIDTVARTDSPGPGTYHILNTTNTSPRLSIGKAPRVSWVDAVSRTDSPGPGTYEVPTTNTSPRLSIGRAPRVSWVDVIARTDSPGPGKYEVTSTNNSPRVSIGKAPKVPWIDVIARTDSPGPGTYNPKVRNGSPSPSIGNAPKVCWVDVVARNDSPGPASYYPSMHFLSK